MSFGIAPDSERTRKEGRKALCNLAALLLAYFICSGHVFEIAAAMLRGETIGCRVSATGDTELYWDRPVPNARGINTYYLYLKEIPRSAGLVALAEFQAGTPVEGTPYRWRSQIDEGREQTILQDRPRGMSRVADGLLNYVWSCRVGNDGSCDPAKMGLSIDAKDSRGEVFRGGTLMSIDGKVFDIRRSQSIEIDMLSPFTNVDLRNFLDRVPLDTCGTPFRTLSYVASFPPRLRAWIFDSWIHLYYYIWPPQSF